MPESVVLVGPTAEFDQVGSSPAAGVVADRKTGRCRELSRCDTVLS
jgi:hypothetical protein